MTELSIIIPVFNEEETIKGLTNEIIDVIQSTTILNKLDAEIIFIDDGSVDNTQTILQKLQTIYKDQIDIIIIELRKNSGQTAAMRAGFENASGKFVITMDADGQNDPNDIPKMYKSITEGKVDVICGWRKNRQDPLSKKIPSKFSNWLHRKLTGLQIHDSGCTLRIYRLEAIKNLPIHGEDHRFLPAIISSRGFKVEEMVVNHRERSGGKSKYGISRLWRGFLDLLSTSFVFTGSSKPLRVFSLFAATPILIGTLILSILAYDRLVLSHPIADRPLLLLGILLEILGLQIFLSGLNAEIISSFTAKSEKRYSIREIHR